MFISTKFGIRCFGPCARLLILLAHREHHFMFGPKLWTKFGLRFGFKFKFIIECGIKFGRIVKGTLFHSQQIRG